MHHPRLLTSTAERSRVECLPQLCSESSSQSCWDTLFGHRLSEHFCTRGRIGIYSTFPVWWQRPKCVMLLSEISSLSMLLHWHLTLGNDCKASWTTSLEPAETSSWLIGLKKTNVMSLEADNLLWSQLTTRVVHKFTYLGFTIMDNHSLDAKINRYIGRTSSTLARLTKSVGKEQTHYLHQDGSI